MVGSAKNGGLLNFDRLTATPLKKISYQQAEKRMGSPAVLGGRGGGGGCLQNGTAASSNSVDPYL